MTNHIPERALFTAVRQYVADVYGVGRQAVRLSVTLDTGEKIRLPIPAPGMAGTGQGPFVPSEFQISLLEALEGKALRTDALAAAADCDRRRMFRDGGLKELQEQGLVSHHARLGYYRPDAPPEGMQ